MQLLREYRRWYLELKLKNGDQWRNTDYLFVKNNGEPMIPDGITAWLADFSERTAYRISTLMLFGIPWPLSL